MKSPTKSTRASKWGPAIPQQDLRESDNKVTAQGQDKTSVPTQDCKSTAQSTGEDKDVTVSQDCAYNEQSMGKDYASTPPSLHAQPNKDDTDQGADTVTADDVNIDDAKQRNPESVDPTTDLVPSTIVTESLAASTPVQSALASSGSSHGPSPPPPAADESVATAASVPPTSSFLTSQSSPDTRQCVDSGDRKRTSLDVDDAEIGRPSKKEKIFDDQIPIIPEHQPQQFNEQEQEEQEELEDKNDNSFVENLISDVFQLDSNVDKKCSNENGLLITIHSA